MQVFTKPLKPAEHGVEGRIILRVQVFRKDNFIQNTSNHLCFVMFIGDKTVRKFIVITMTVLASEPDSENRMARAMYKLAVETSKLSHVIAYSHGVDEEALKKLQAKCTDEVKRINGAVTFEDAYRFQNE